VSKTTAGELNTESEPPQAQLVRRRNTFLQGLLIARIYSSVPLSAKVSKITSMAEAVELNHGIAANAMSK
jgi:hypothetical protein